MTEPSTTSPGHVAHIANVGPPIYVEWMVIALGGALGAGLRHAISVSLNAGQWHFVLATGVANLLGSLGLGFLAGYLATGPPRPLLRPFLTTGVFGSFTTFSALAMDNRRLAADSSELAAAVHLASAVFSALAVFVLADRLSVHFFRRGGE
jgi:CrcB protein